MPFAIGQAIEDGIVNSDNRALAAWALVLLGLGAVQAAAGIMRHRYAVFNWLQASFRMAQVVSHHSARSGPAVRGRLSTGEVVATVSNDAMRGRRVRHHGAALGVDRGLLRRRLRPALGLGRARACRARRSPGACVAPRVRIKPLQERQRDQREEVGKLTAGRTPPPACGCCAGSAASRRSTTAIATARRWSATQASASRSRNPLSTQHRFSSRDSSSCSSRGSAPASRCPGGSTSASSSRSTAMRRSSSSH